MILVLCFAGVPFHAYSVLVYCRLTKDNLSSPSRWYGAHSLNEAVLLLCTKERNTIVSRKYAPPFATLVLVQNTGGGGGGAYINAGCDNFSELYTEL